MLSIQILPAAAAGVLVASSSDRALSQNTYTNNGVLVCRADEFDEKMLGIIDANNLFDVQKYTEWLKEKVVYASDRGEDRWESPSATLDRGNGDCEDYAFLNKAVLKVLGIDSEVLALGRSSANHAICVFKRDGCYWWIDNFRLKRTPARTRDELASYIFAEYDYTYILSVDFASRSWNLLYRRSEVI